MKLAIFGGTGFLGYDFLQEVFGESGITPVIYTTHPKSLVNVARHDLDIRLITMEAIGLLEVDADTDFIVNFAHPFSVRGGLSSRQQLDGFIQLVRREKARLPGIRLIHLSTMSVYEPFEEAIKYRENDHLHPPQADIYAQDKVYIERKLRELPESDVWQLHLRPTIVYGPFCRPWTDALLEAFHEGDVTYADLSGRIQPVYGHDVSRFIRDCLHAFQPGVFNFAGMETCTWQEFLGYMGEIAGHGKLVHRTDIKPTDTGATGHGKSSYWSDIKELVKVTVKQPSFDRIALRVVRWLPRSAVQWIRDAILGDRLIRGMSPPTPLVSAFANPFFETDRLVSMEHFRQTFPDFQFAPMAENREILRRYYLFRFTETRFGDSRAVS